VTSQFYVMGLVTQSDLGGIRCSVRAVDRFARAPAFATDRPGVERVLTCTIGIRNLTAPLFRDGHAPYTALL
jgi:hypothetical protein